MVVRLGSMGGSKLAKKTFDERERGLLNALFSMLLNRSHPSLKKAVRYLEEIPSGTLAPGARQGRASTLRALRQIDGRLDESRTAVGQGHEAVAQARIARARRVLAEAKKRRGLAWARMPFVNSESLLDLVGGVITSVEVEVFPPTPIAPGIMQWHPRAKRPRAS